MRNNMFDRAPSNSRIKKFGLVYVASMGRGVGNGSRGPPARSAKAAESATSAASSVQIPSTSDKAKQQTTDVTMDGATVVATQSKHNDQTVEDTGVQMPAVSAPALGRHQRILMLHILKYT